MRSDPRRAYRPAARSRPARPILLAALTALAPACAPPLTHSLVPAPHTARVEPGDSFTVDTLAVIAAAGGDESRRIAGMLAGLIGTTAETTPTVVPAEDPAAGGAAITLAVDDAHRARLGPEGYTLAVTAGGIRVEAAEPAGLFYGMQTLRQLMPPVVEYDAARPRPLRVPYTEIEDRPRFGWRGAMLDVARHFFGVDDVKRYIDLLALHKLNRLHLHLSDDQGWRIEIPGWPRLTEHGGSTEVGGGPGGFYTAAEYRELVRYAADRFITIVPEIDMPGHTNAALASYPELNCDGVAPELYTGIRVGFSALCVEKEVTYEFVDAVVGALATLTPGPWIHIGGDEVEELTEEEYRHFIERVQEIVRGHGKRMVGWGEIAAAELEPTSLIQHWRGEGEYLDEVRAGQVILSPSAHVYLDIQYHPGTPIGLDWPGHTPLRDSYDWDPAGLVPGLPADAIAGIEAPLWTETVATVHDIEFMAFPRLAAVAELAWSPPGALDWDRFRRRLARHGLRLTALGVNFHRTPEVDWARW
ncbi:MAG: family 20 glycosylhydrolase [Gemmatimonadetes bacterium]|nr:family 20 glycosylhydrolase [Gemmatimonadota bacterium]NIQ58099.1 family 20 glycosylhydrolase [Gemmatimonadota bacterium]NIU78301.1 family 20 glycosylhydrolase [Gammaproteobacteria bacterium]NIX47255.1 family 20 glycosylhydrolase [Gemmatimonadota bacterium]NIY11632.1 family 20 glycosylhydrolase [Gemmatimonadota bacterium]